MFFSRKKKEYILTPTQELLLALLRAQLWLKPVDDIVLPSKMEEWDDLMDLGYRQTVICFIAAACLRHKDVEKLPAVIRDEMIAVLEENTKIHEFHNRTIVEVFSLLEDNGLHPILLKGQGLAQIYPQPELRQCGDVDIFIGPKDYEKACHIMDDYCGPESKQNAFYEDQLHYHISNGRVTFEIHRKAADAAKTYRDKQFNAWAYEWLIPEKCDSVTINEKQILIPNPQYNTLYVFDHLIKHIRCEGVNIRQFCDWMVILRNNLDVINLDWLNKSLKKYSSPKAWENLGRILVCLFEYDKKTFPFWTHKKSLRLQSCIVNEILNGGNFCSSTKFNDRRKNLEKGLKRTLFTIYYCYQLSYIVYIISFRSALVRFSELLYCRIKYNLSNRDVSALFE